LSGRQLYALSLSEVRYYHAGGVVVSDLIASNIFRVVSRSLFYVKKSGLPSDFFEWFIKSVMAKYSREMQ
jgi:hypothetical protein